jgi:hypothetical protein
MDSVAAVEATLGEGEFTGVNIIGGPTGCFPDPPAAVRFVFLPNS